jgi:ankyrin repeat protein
MHSGGGRKRRRRAPRKNEFLAKSTIQEQPDLEKSMRDGHIHKQEDLDIKLKHAMFTHDYRQARHLVDQGADPNTTNSWGAPFIYWCAEKGKTDLIDLALEKGADVHATNKTGETALHRAAFVGKVEIIDHLMDRGADVDKQNIHGATPLFVAALRDQLEAVKKLLSRGADPSIRNRNGVSAAEIAKEKGHDAIAALLADV